LADSAKGKFSHNDPFYYTGAKDNKLPLGYRLYHPTSSIFISFTEFYTHYKSLPAHKKKKIKIKKSDGTDIKSETLKYGKTLWEQEQSRLRALALKQKREKAAEEAKSGYYCDCKMSKIYKTPCQVPKNMTEAQLSVAKGGAMRKVPVTQDKECKFCGYYTIYKLFKNGKEPRPSLVKPKGELCQKSRAKELRRLNRTRA
jgi:hypothetical protein